MYIHLQYKKAPKAYIK